MLVWLSIVVFLAAPQQSGGRTAGSAEPPEKKRSEQTVRSPDELLNGDPEAAYEAIRAGLEKQPDSVPLLKAAGMLLLRDRRRSIQAREPLARAAEIAPKDPEAHYFYSQWACMHNQEELCIREAQKALALDPDNLMAGLQLNALIGIAADKLNQPERASEAFRKSLADNRKLGFPDPLAAHRYVLFLLNRGREEEAQTLVAQMVKAAPHFGPASLERAKFLARKGEQKEAIALAEKSLQMEGMDKENLRAAHMLLARAYFLLGRDEDAARHQAWIEDNPH